MTACVCACVYLLACLLTCLDRPLTVNFQWMPVRVLSLRLLCQVLLRAMGLTTPRRCCEGVGGHIHSWLIMEVVILKFPELGLALGCFFLPVPTMLCCSGNWLEGHWKPASERRDDHLPLSRWRPPYCNSTTRETGKPRLDSWAYWPSNTQTRIIAPAWGRFFFFMRCKDTVMTWWIIVV